MYSISSQMQNPISPHQRMYEVVRGRSPHWKDNFRKKCMDRVRVSRARLVDKFRNIEINSSSKPCFKQEALTVMESVWSGDDNHKHFSLSQDEEMHLLEEIEKEIRMFNEKQIEDILNFEEADLSQLVDHSQQRHVFCPVCQKSALQECVTQGASMVGCSCGLVLKGVNIQKVESDLVQTIALHEKSCCNPLSFNVSNMPVANQIADVANMFTTNVLISCSQCEWMSFLL